MVAPEAVFFALLHCDRIPIYVSISVAGLWVLSEAHDRSERAHDDEYFQTLSLRADAKTFFVPLTAGSISSFTESCVLRKNGEAM